MSKPIVAIVGRPNVGKSTLFNVLAGSRIAIIEDTPGVTRDRIYADVEWSGRSFTLIDTGGIEPDAKDIILSQMREQAQIAIDTADVILFLTDFHQGLVDADAKVADMLRRSHKSVLLVVNKVDNFCAEAIRVFCWLSTRLTILSKMRRASTSFTILESAIRIRFPRRTGRESAICLTRC